MLQVWGKLANPHLLALPGFFWQWHLSLSGQISCQITNSITAVIFCLSNELLTDLMKKNVIHLWYGAIYKMIIIISSNTPYFFTYKLTLATSWDPKSLRPSNRLVLPKRKSKTITYKARAKFLIVTGHLSEETSRKKLGNRSMNTRANEWE